MVENANVEKGQFGWFSNIVSPHSVWKSPKILPFTRYVVKWYFSGHFQKLCSCLHAKLIFQTFRLLKVASFLMQRKQLCSSSVFPSSLLNGRLRRRRRRHACPYRVEKANFYGSATGIKLCVCWEKKWHGNVETKNTTDAVVVKCIGRRGSSFFHSFPNKSTRFSMLFLLLLCFILRDVLVLPRK